MNYLLGTNLDDKEDDEKGFEWINSNHPRMYATAAVAEQNSLNCPAPYSLYSNVTKDPVALNRMKQQPALLIGQDQTFSTSSATLPSKHQTFISANYNTMIPPHSKYGHVHKVSVLKKTD